MNPSDPLPAITTRRYIDAGGVGGRIVDVEALKRLAIRLMALAEQHTDLPLQRDLRKLANELVDLIDQSEKARQPH